MPHINLLPWRELQREQSKKKFITLLMAVVIVCFVTMYALSTFYSALKEGQMLKNNYLSSEITMLDQKIRDIRDLDMKKENLQQRMRLIEELQSSRNLGTQIMDEVAKIVPAGVYLTKLERKGSQIHVLGKSESNNRLSTMLRQVQSSYLLERPTMQGIVAGDQSSRLLSDFNMEFYVKPFGKIGEVPNEP